MTTEQAQEIDLCAVLNAVTYLDSEGGELNNKNLREILDYCSGNPDFAGKSGELNMIKVALEKNSDWADITLVDTSKIDTHSVPDVNAARPSTIDSSISTTESTDDYIQGMTFTDKDGNYYVAYRGTGDGRWTDNGEGMVQTTDMQKAAALYFDQMAEEYGFDEAHADGKRIIVTGHSKGGNEAQYVYMASEHADSIDYCYAMDGQGFPEQTIKEFEERWGPQGSEEWNRHMEGLYSICGENDYVHPLGIVIATATNTYYVKATEDSIEGYHALPSMVNFDNERKELLNWTHKDGNPDGEIVNGEPGEIAKFAEHLSEQMMKLPPEVRDGAAKTFMRLIDLYMQKELWSDKNLGPGLSWADYMEFVAYGDLTIFASVISYYYEKNQIGTLLGIFAGLTIIYLMPELACVYLMIKAVAALYFTALEGAKKFIESVYNAFETVAKKIGDYFRSKSYGGRYASDHPQIVVDTKALGSYATRLNVVNNRLAALDKRMDSLYGKVGWLDLWNLLKADLLTGKSKTLKKCISYLNDTQTLFDNVENELKSI